jgi:hypothetical protein
MRTRIRQVLRFGARARGPRPDGVVTPDGPSPRWATGRRPDCQTWVSVRAMSATSLRLRIS